MLFALLFSVLSYAADASLEGYFPATCPGSPKASRAYQPRVTLYPNSIELRFKLQLLACDGERFVPYVSQEKEYVEIYQITAMNGSIRARLSDEVSAVVPYDPQGAPVFRVDIFLYGMKIPYKLTLTESGEALLSPLN